MNTVKDIFNTFKKPIIAIIAFLVLYLGLTQVLPMVQNAQANTSPIKSITATNDNIYKSTSEIKVSDFDVTALHDSGKKSSVSRDNIIISKSKPNKTGKTTSIKVSLKDQEDIFCVVKVKNERTEIISFDCGNPRITDVRAVLYSNGELCFEGEGDVLQYDSSFFPWQQYEGMEENPITAVTFEETVTPINMDNWFASIATLTYVAEIPSSVESMAGTFSDCIELKKGPKWSDCTNLLNLSKTFSGCQKLEEIDDLPSKVKNTTSMCYNCISLQNAPDVSNALSLTDATSMYEQCKILTNVSMPANVKIIDGMFKYCINLKDMPEIPESVTSMVNTFQGDASLKTLTIIPKNVEDVTGCFDSCGRVSGLLWIDANPSNYNGFLNQTAVATTLDLQGNSKMLDILASTSDKKDNITVNGAAPNRDIEYSDIIIE